MFQSLKHDSETEDCSSSFDVDLDEEEDEEVVVMVTPPRQLPTFPLQKRDRSPLRKRVRTEHSKPIDYRVGKFVTVLCKIKGITRHRVGIIRNNLINFTCFEPPAGLSKVELDKITKTSKGWAVGSDVHLEDYRSGVLHSSPQIFISWIRSDSVAPICKPKWTLIDVVDIVANAVMPGNYSIPANDREETLFQVINLVPQLRSWLNSSQWTMNLSPQHHLYRRIPSRLDPEQCQEFKRLTHIPTAGDIKDLLRYVSNEIPLFTDSTLTAWAKAGVPLSKKVTLFNPVETIIAKETSTHPNKPRPKALSRVLELANYLHYKKAGRNSVK